MSFTCKRVVRHYDDDECTMRHESWEVGFDEFMGGSDNEVRYQVVARLENATEAACLCNFLNGGEGRVVPKPEKMLDNHVAKLLGNNLPEYNDAI